MLISFEVENWMSFRDKVTFSMVASRERQHRERVPRIKDGLGILPIAALFGGNASGKTNFFKALYFVRQLVVKGTQPDSPIRTEPFRLDPNYNDRPSRFKFELLIDEEVFEFSFSTTRNNIVEEKLLRISGSNEIVLYHRNGTKKPFHDNNQEDGSLMFAYKGTRDNQLFLTNTIDQKIENYRPVYDWFKYSLVLIAPDYRFGSREYLIKEEHPLYTFLSSNLSKLDTGISHLGGEDISLSSLQLPEYITNKVQELKEGKSLCYFNYIFSRIDGKLVAKKLMAWHKQKSGTEIPFEIYQESDGSQRIIDLLPAFQLLSRIDLRVTYIIDELDRSLHTILVRRLLESYLLTCSNESRSQLIFSTHDALQMDQSLLRRDEMWILERDLDGVSSLLSLTEYKGVRFDKDIRKMYLQGRFGGIPRLLLNGQLVRCEPFGSSEGDNK